MGYAFRPEDVPQEWLEAVKARSRQRWGNGQAARVDPPAQPPTDADEVAFLRWELVRKNEVIDRLLRMLEERSG